MLVLWPKQTDCSQCQIHGPLTVTSEHQGQHMLAPCESIYYGGCSTLQGLSRVLISEHVSAILSTHGPSASLMIPASPKYNGLLGSLDCEAIWNEFGARTHLWCIRPQPQNWLGGEELLGLLTEEPGGVKLEKGDFGTQGLPGSSCLLGVCGQAVGRKGLNFPHCERRKWLYIKMVHLFSDNPVIEQNCLSDYTTGDQRFGGQAA